MKNLFLFIASAVLVAAVSCNRAEQLEMPGNVAMGEISVNIGLHGQGMTRAAYTSETEKEGKITGIQLLIFHEDGSLAYYKNIGTSLSENISLAGGTKTVWAVANAGDLSHIGTLTELRGVEIELAANNDPGSDFVMAGCNTITIGKEPSVDVVMSRFVSRVVLNKLTNGMPPAAGAITVKNVFISNVVANQTLAENSDSPSDWYNQMGRKTDTSSSAAIIDGDRYTASAPALTFKSINRSVNAGADLAGVPYLFYSYPNNTTADTPGWTNNFTSGCTRLVVVASIGNDEYYYPVTIKGPTLRNNTYSVDMTITGPGSDDPDKPVQKGAFEVTLSVQGWLGTTTYTETF